MLKRIISLLLVFVMCLECLPPLTAAAEEEPGQDPAAIAEEAAEPSVPETTEPEPSVPETTEPEPSVPETTEPEPSVPETTEPEPSVPETTEPEPSVPETTEPEPSVPETTEPEPSVPETTEPEPSVPETTEPEPSVPETTEPEPSVPETTEPEPSVPETTVPEEVCHHEIAGDCPICYAEALIAALPELEEVEGREFTEEEFDEITMQISQAMSFFYDELTTDQQRRTEGWGKLEALISFFTNYGGDEDIAYVNMDANIGDVIRFTASKPSPTYGDKDTYVEYTWRWSVSAVGSTPKTAYEVIRNDDSSQYLSVAMRQPGYIRVNATAHLSYRYYESRLGEWRTGSEDADAGYWYVNIKSPSVTVRYDANGGTASTTKRVLKNGTYGTQPSASWDGYTFEGWYYGGTQYKSNDYLAVYENHTLTAQWAKNGTLNFNSKGGTPKSYKKDILLNRPIGNILPSPTRKGYVLIGWEDSSGNTVTSNSQLAKTGLTVYAKWKKLRKIKLDCGGGKLADNAVSSFEQISGRAYPSLPTPIREDYIFTGWALEDGTPIQSGDIMSLDRDHALIAQWKYFPWKLKSGVLTISGDGPMYEPGDNTKFPWYIYRSSITSVVIGGGLTTLACEAFSGYTNLTSVTVNADLTHIGREAFSGCTRLASINFPGSLESIGDNAFYQCSSLKSAAFPTGLTLIGGSAFSGCTKLRSLDFPDGLQSIGAKAFQGCTGITELLIPAGTEITSNSFSGCRGVTKITAMPEQASSAYSGCSNATHIVIMEGATELNDMDNFTRLTGITLPSTLQKIGSYAFGNCTSLKKIVIPNGVTSIGAKAFQGCDALTSVVIGSGVREIGANAFYKCKALTEVVMLDGVETIGDSAFASCTALKTITLPDSVTALGDAAFSKCSNLYQVNLSSNLKTIGEIAFGTCTRLSRITIPASVTQIGSEAFGTCSTYFTITFQGPPPRLGAYLFYNLRVTVNVPSTYYYSYSHKDYAAIKATWNYYDAYHTHSWGSASTIRQATCAVPGEKFYLCSVCNQSKAEELPQTSHRETITKGYPATCTKSGLTDGIYCADCDNTLQIQTVIPATGHTEQLVAGFAADCTTAGLTDSKICSVCRTVLKEQTVISALGHSPRLHNNSRPSCEAEGYSGDMICLRCNTVTQSGVILPATGHSFRRINQADPTCTTAGNTGHLECAGCQKLHDTDHTDQVLSALGHDPALRRIPAQAATDTEYGNSVIVINGCSRCDLWFADDTCQTLMTEEEITALRQQPENIVYAKAKKVEITEIEYGNTEVTTGRAVPKTINLTDYPDGILLRAQVLPVTAKQNITWSSSNTKIATVGKDGRVRFKKPGKVTISAAANSKCVGKVSISAGYLAEDLTILGPGDEEFFIGAAAGKTITLRASILPKNVTNKTVKWSVAEESAKFASINSKGQIKISKNAPIGEDILVYATAADGSGVMDYTYVEVYPAVKTLKLKLDPDYSNGLGCWLDIVATPKDTSETYHVSSSNPKVATVDAFEEYGGPIYVEYKGAGTTTITCKAADGSGVKATYKVTVKPHSKYLGISQMWNVNIAEGQSIPLEVHASDPYVANPKVTWTVSDPDVVSVDKNNVLAARPGTAGKTSTITVTSTDGYQSKDSITVTVVPASSQLQIFREDGTRIQEGDIVEYDAYPKDYDDMTESWDPSWDTGEKMTFKVLPEGSDNRLRFISSDPDIVDPWQPSVNDWGEETTIYRDFFWISSGSKPGMATVTVAPYDGSPHSLTFYVKVRDHGIQQLDLPQDLQVLGGKSLTIQPQISPRNATNTALKWSVSNTKAASISSSGVLKTKTVKKATQITVTAKAQDGSGLEASCTVLICPKATSVGILRDGKSVTKKTVKLPTVGENSMILSASAAPAGASTQMAWTSSNTKAVSVQTLEDGTCLVTALKAGTAVITAKAKDGSKKSASVTISAYNPVSGITLTNRTVAGGKALTMSASFAPANATNKAVTWSVKNPENNSKLTSINSKGQLKTKTVKVPTDVLVTAVSKENPEITATCTVTLYPLAAKATLYENGKKLGSTKKLSVDNLLFLSTQVSGKTADTEVSQKVTYSTSNASIAKVYQDGMVLPIKPGTVTITVKAADGSGVKDTIKLTVVQHVKELSVTGRDWVAGGKRITLKASASPSNATSKAVTWSVSDKTLASITSKGVLTAKSLKEQATVTVRAAAADGSGTVAEYDVLIYPAATKLRLEYFGRPVTAKTITMRVGESMNLDTVATPEAAYQQATWSSSKSSIAKVNTSGIVTARKKGTATITATAADGSGKKVTIKISVK